MKSRPPVGAMRVVRNLGPRFHFVSIQQDVEVIKEMLGAPAQGYDSFFALPDDSGADYSEVWGMCGIVPRLDKLVSRLK